jgi:regulator of RNase E activity RraA
MIFPLAQLVADLSQHFTLEPGDVILTGTPAGSSVIVPGDVVVIEVDAPHSSKTFSSGGLRTTVVQGDVPFDGALGSLPAVDDLQRAEAWGSREAAGLAPEAATAAPAPALDPALREKLLAAPTAGLSSQLRKRGLHACFIDGVSANAPGAKIVGTAKTLRFVPAREDLFKTHGGGYNAQKRAFDAVEEGEVIVIEARGDASTGTLGDILALRAKVRGAAGVVTDGGVRDYAAVAEIGLPVFSQGAHPSVLGRKHVPWDVDVTIACGGAAVQPGDIIVGDSDGVIVIPPSLAEEVADAALAQEEEDAWIAEQVEAGHPVDGLFPMDAAWRAKYDAAHATGPEEA